MLIFLKIFPLFSLKFWHNINIINVHILKFWILLTLGLKNKEESQSLTCYPCAVAGTSRLFRYKSKTTTFNAKFFCNANFHIWTIKRDRYNFLGAKLAFLKAQKQVNITEPCFCFCCCKLFTIIIVCISEDLLLFLEFDVLCWRIYALFLIPLLYCFISTYRMFGNRILAFN